MKTVTLTINDETYERVAHIATLLGTTIEEQIIRHIAVPDGERLINDRDELLRAAEAFHRHLAARGFTPLTDEEIREAINAGRE